MKILILIFLTACAQVTSLNMKKHQLGLTPTKIIWFQIAGLEEEQLAMLRFNQAGDRKTSFEETICIGKSWNYNLYNVRNSAPATFLSQMTGKKNIKNTCEDGQLKPVWSYLGSHQYLTGIIESGANKEQSLVQYNSCGEESRSFLAGTYMWQRQEPPKGQATFHYADNIPVKAGEIYYDRSCSAKSCFSSITDDFKAIYERFGKISSKHLLIIRDFSYLASLDKKDFKEARRILSDIEKAYSEALVMASGSNDYLVLLTTADSRFVDMPDQGKAWYEFEKQGSGPVIKRTKLSNLILASGARAENFCGVYEDSHIMERMLSGPRQQGLEFKLINPFKN